MNILRDLAPYLIAPLLCSCAATSVKKTWKSPDYTGGPEKRIAALVIDERNMLRQGFENRFVSQLKSRGATPIVTYDILSLGQIGQDKRAAAEQFRAAGADVLLILHVVDVSMGYREVRGNERYAAVVDGFGSDYWYDYYTVAFMDMSPTYASTQHNVILETSLYDLKTAKRLWSGITKTVLKDNMDRVAEMDPLVEKILGAMHKDGMVP
jgi:hypothetical protein